MAVAFMGNAIGWVQETGLIPITSLLDEIHILDESIASMIEIHPTLKTGMINCTCRTLLDRTYIHASNKSQK